MNIFLITGLLYGAVTGYGLARLNHPARWAAGAWLLLTLAWIPLPWCIPAAAAAPIAVLFPALKSRRPGNLSSITALGISAMLLSLTMLLSQGGNLGVAYFGGSTGLCAALLGTAHGQRPENSPLKFWGASIFLGLLSFALGSIGDMLSGLLALATYVICLFGANKPPHTTQSSSTNGSQL